MKVSPECWLRDSTTDRNTITARGVKPTGQQASCVSRPVSELGVNDANGFILQQQTTLHVSSELMKQVWRPSRCPIHFLY